MQILTKYEREKIEFCLKLKMKKREIARQLKRNHSIIVREINRNMDSRKHYSADLAQRKAEQKAKKTNKRKLEKIPRLRDYVKEKIKKDWSPEQIAGRLKHYPPQELKGQKVSHETIYQYIYEGEGMYENLFKHLRRGRPKRQKRWTRKKRKKIIIPNRISVHERIMQKDEVGHWESDTVICSKQKSALSVQYEKSIQLARLHKIADKSAAETEQALIKTVESVDNEMAKTMAFDNGTEGALHGSLVEIFGMKTYFCDPYCSWQKGGVENLNGLIRQYLPRSTKLDDLSNDKIFLIEEKLNTRPRKGLNFLSPNEAYQKVINNGGALNP